jgi:hypothetical protein
MRRMAVLGLLVCAGTAEAGTIYVMRWDTNELLSFDTRALTMTTVGPTGVDNDWGAMAWDPTTNTMYMIGGRFLPNLYTIDINTGRATLIGPHGLDDLFALSVDPNTGRVYGMQGTFFQGLYELDKRTGQSTFVGNTASPFSGADWDPQGRGIIANGSFTADFYLIDVRTGQSTFQGNGGIAPSDTGLAYDPDTRLFWTFDVAGQINSYDPNNGYRGASVMNVGFPMDGASGANGSAFLETLDFYNVNGFCPGPERFRVTGATPGGEVAFMMSRQLGDGEIPGGPCEGVQLPVVRPRLISRVRADANGWAELNANANASQCGIVKLLAIDLDTCGLSNIQTP